MSRFGRVGLIFEMGESAMTCEVPGEYHPNTWSYHPVPVPGGIWLPWISVKLPSHLPLRKIIPGSVGSHHMNR